MTRDTAIRRAELERLARVLRVPPDRLRFLEEAQRDDLRALRIAVADRLLDRSRQGMERALAVADLIPVALAAKLAEHALGAVLSARAASLLAPARAADFAHRLPPRFLAEIACHLDLRIVGSLIAGISQDVLAEAGECLREREEWIVLAAFVDHLPHADLARQLHVYDGEALLRLGFAVEDTARLDELVGLLGDDRLDELLAAAGEHGLWPEAVSLATHLGPRQAARIAAAVERLDDPELTRLEALLTADPDQRLAAEPIVSRLPEELRVRVGG